MVRVPSSHGGSREFESLPAHHDKQRGLTLIVAPFFVQKKLTLFGKGREQTLAEKEDFLLWKTEVGIGFKERSALFGIQGTGHNIPIEGSLVAFAGGQ